MVGGRSNEEQSDNLYAGAGQVVWRQALPRTPRLASMEWSRHTELVELHLSC
jgi:hypothetical protein